MAEMLISPLKSHLGAHALLFRKPCKQTMEDYREQCCRGHKKGFLAALDIAILK